MKLRETQGLTQVELGGKIGFSQKAVAHYETGIKAPELAKLPSIAKALGVGVPELFEEGGGQKKATATRSRGNPNKRAVKLQQAFEKLKPLEQQLILKQVDGLVGKR